MVKEIIYPLGAEIDVRAVKVGAVGGWPVAVGCFGPVRRKHACCRCVGRQGGVITMAGSHRRWHARVT